MSIFFPILIQLSLERLMKETLLVCLYLVAMAMLLVTLPEELESVMMTVNRSIACMYSEVPNFLPDFDLWNMSRENTEHRSLVGSVPSLYASGP